MKNAVAAVKAGMTVRNAAIQFGIPRTLSVNNVKKSASTEYLALNYKHSMMFLSEQENLFAEYPESCSKMFDGLTLANVALHPSNKTQPLDSSIFGPLATPNIVRL